MRKRNVNNDIKVQELYEEQSELKPIIKQTGYDLSMKKSMGEILLALVSYFVLQIIPIIAIFVIPLTSTKARFDQKVIIENLLVICIVTNASGIINNSLV